MTSREPGTVVLLSLRYYRRRAMLTQEQLAERAHVGRSTVINGEKQLPIRLTSANQLAIALGLGRNPHRLREPPPDD